MNIVNICSKFEFNEDQKKQILIGMMKGIDVSIYAKPEFERHQMYEIRKGLEKGLDVSEYAKPELHSVEMRIIRKSLEEKQKSTPKKRHIYINPEHKIQIKKNK